MSRIDEALRRLKGGNPEPRLQPLHVERFPSEGKVNRVDESGKSVRSDDHKVATFVAPPSHAADMRPPIARKAAVPPPPPARPAPEPKPVEPKIESPDVEPEIEKLIDFRQIADYLGFVLRSIRRHKVLSGVTFGVAFAMTIAAALLMPKTFYVQVKLLAQRNAVMTALSNPGRAVPWDADAPTRAAAETVLRRDNLISLITQTDLINEWERRREPILKLKDKVWALVTRHEMTPDEQLDVLVGTLENRMSVTAGPVGDGTVTIELYWPDAEMAYRLVERAQQAFLDARQVAETSAISESIAILERYTASLHEDVNRTLSELQRTQPRARTDVGRVRTLAPRRTTLPPSIVGSTIPALDNPIIDSSVSPDPELARLRNEVNAKRMELSKLEDGRKQQLSELQARLGALQTIYTPNHPSVMSLQQNIAALQYESPQVAALRSQLDKLETEYDEKAAADADKLIQSEITRRGSAPVPVPVPVAPDVAAAPIEEAPLAPSTTTERMQDQAAEFATLRLRTELNQLQSILERTDGARIELAVSQAAFKYRYTVIKPAQEPRDPVFPNVRLVILAGFLASAVLAICLALAVDLMSNRILEAWQVQRQLGLPILGTVRA
jgi:uncharacterized protein involved in exopolysaccharide biosynthesis